MGKSRRNVKTVAEKSFVNMAERIDVSSVEAQHSVRMVGGNKTAKTVEAPGVVCMEGSRDFVETVVELDCVLMENGFILAKCAKS